MATCQELEIDRVSDKGGAVRQTAERRSALLSYQAFELHGSCCSASPAAQTWQFFTQDL